MAALAAALLAVVLLLDARPSAGTEREAARRLCLEGLALSTPGLFTGAGSVFANNPAIRRCAETGTAWNVQKQMHALLAAGLAALLLVLTALIPARRQVVLDTGWPQVRLTDDTLSRSMEEERMRASRDEGRNITPGEARTRVEASVRKGPA